METGILIVVEENFKMSLIKPDHLAEAKRKRYFTD